MSGGEISGNTASSTSTTSNAYGGGVYVGRRSDGNGGYVSGTFTKESGGTIYGSDASDSLKNTASGDAYGHAAYVESGSKKRNSTAGPGVTLNSSLGEAEGGWVDQYTVTFDADGGSPATRTLTVNSGVISNIVHSSVSGSAWTLENDGRRKSPAIAHDSASKARVDFISAVDNAVISIQLDVSSELGFDYAFVSTLDNDSATYESGYYTNSRISGTESIMVTIPVPTAGSHFVEIGYRKNNSISTGSDCAWFKVTSADAGDFIIPPAPTRNGYTFDGWYTERNGGGVEFTAASMVNANITVYAKWQ